VKECKTDRNRILSINLYVKKITPTSCNLIALAII